MTKPIRRLLTFLEQNEALVILLLITVVLRLPSLHEPYWYGDEGVYLTLGQALRKGLVWYRDIHDNKPPLLYLLAALSGNVLWFRFTLLLANLANVLVIWKLAKKFFSDRGVLLTTFLFVLATSLPPLEGNIANAEIFMILPVSLAMLLLLEASKLKHYFFAGLLFAAGFLFKVPALFDFIAAGFWLVLFGGLKFRSDRQSIIKLVLLGLGFALPVLVTFVYYFVVGAGQEYLVAAFLQNLGYLGSWRTGTISKSGFTSASGLGTRAVLLLVSTVVIWFLTRKEESRRRLLPLWFVFSLFGALLSERPYPHYLIQLVPPAVLLIPHIFQKEKRVYMGLILALAALTVGAIFKYRFYFYPTLSYYWNFGQYVTGRISTQTYRNSFDWRVNRNYEIAKYIKLRTTPEDRIFVWGDEPFIYALADRLPAGRFTVAYHIIDFNGQETTMTAIREKPPLFIVLEKSETRSFKTLEAFTLANYVAVATFEDATVYRHLNQDR